MIQFLFLLFLTIFNSLLANADSPRTPYTYVTGGRFFYAKSLPPNITPDKKGQTKIYRVMPGEDVLVATYEAYSLEVFLMEAGFQQLEDGSRVMDVYVVLPGPWNSGGTAQKDHTALVFYKNQQLIKIHSAEDIVKYGGVIAASVSHYQVIDKYIGFDNPLGSTTYFAVKTLNGKILHFDLETGELVPKKAMELAENVIEIESIIAELKYDWYKEHGKKNTKLLITEEMLKKAYPKKFPKIPVGYKYIPSAFGDSPMHHLMKSK